ncbi:MAG: hypothetical protein COB12_07410 [Flavobacterium sp.]|nr:MAG: hypothetical protein COB12_07410 [Flavobacterium sp.]
MNKILIIVVLFIISPLQAQNFNSIIEDLDSAIKTVPSANKEYVQTITSIQPGVVEVTIEEISKKGSSTVNSFEFNTADIDINTIKTITKKDVIVIQLLAKNKQKLIKLTTNQEKISYVNQLLINAENIDNGRLIEDYFKQCVPLAQEITDKRLSLSSYQEQLNWLENNVIDVNLIKKQFSQNLAANNKYPGSIIIKSNEIAGKNSKNRTYQLNLSTLNPNSILFKITGEIFSIELETRRKLKTIKYFEDSEQKAYTNKLTIVCNSVENARDLQKVLKDIISLSEIEFNNSLTKINSISQGVQLINSLTNKVVVNDLTITQNIDGKCVSVFKQETLDNNNTVQETFNFNFADFNKNGINYSTNGKQVFLELNIKGGNNYIKYEKNGEQKNYIKSLKIYTPEIEDAITLESTLSSIINLCQNPNNSAFKAGSKSNMLQILQQNLSKININNITYDQSLKINENVLIFTNTIINTKSSKEQIFEFNLSDINSNSIKMNTSGKNVTVTASTYHLEKIIKYYENGAIKNYQNEIEIQAINIENARLITNLLVSLTEK